MDPKALASLDPKLRETYEKVMGTSTTPSPQTPASGNSTPPPSKTSTLIPGLIKPQPQPASTRPDSIGVQSGPTPPIPAPVNSPLPNIPQPASPLMATNNSFFPSPSINTRSVVTASSPIQQTPDLAVFQATPTGIPLQTTQGSAVQLGKPIQPLPSPASINKSFAPSSQSSPFIRILYIIASIVFFAVYTIFWLKIFKYPIPFLPF